MLRQQLKLAETWKKRTWRARFLFFLSLFILASVATSFYNVYKPMPTGLDYVSEKQIVNLSDLTFLTDTTYSLNNTKQQEQKIWPTIFSYIDQAEQYIMLDMFLFNDGYRKAAPEKILAKELTNRLVAKKEANPSIKIDFITDPINTVYGSAELEEIERLRKAGVNVIITDLNKLRDPNPIWSGPWRLAFSWLGTGGFGWLPNPFAKTGEPVSLRAYLAMLNFKANHRKVMIADNNNRLVSVISSSNPHGGSGNHTNAAWVIKGNFGLEIYKTEQVVANLSNNSLFLLPENLQKDIKAGENLFAESYLLTENKIKEALLKEINSAGNGDILNLAMFYLSDKDIIQSLIASARRGTQIKIILDPNKDAFGYQKNGVPNRAVANVLIKESASKIQIRWYDTHGEQFHSKFLVKKSLKDNKITIITGSANFTRRNLENYNLETDAMLIFDGNSALANQAINYFEQLWQNKEGVYTADYGLYKDDSLASYLKYWLEETTGFSSF